jgi:hypothetical protein
MEYVNISRYDLINNKKIYDENGVYYGVFGVNNAVNEFCTKNSYKLYVTNEFWGTWWITK